MERKDISLDYLAFGIDDHLQTQTEISCNVDDLDFCKLNELQNVKQKYREAMEKMSRHDSSPGEDDDFETNEVFSDRLKKLNNDPEFRLSKDIFSAYSQDRDGLPLGNEETLQWPKDENTYGYNPEMAESYLPQENSVEIEANPEFKELLRELQNDLKLEEKMVRELKAWRENEMQEEINQQKVEEGNLMNKVNMGQLEKQIADEIMKMYLP